MSRVTLALILAVCSPAFAAVKVGDTQKDAIAEMGRPASIRQTANGAVWKFKDGTTLKLENGIVAEITPPGGKSSAEAPAAEPVLAVEDKPAVAAPPAPATAPAARPAARTATPPTSEARSAQKAAAPRSSATPTAPTNQAAAPKPNLHPVQGANVRNSSSAKAPAPFVPTPVSAGTKVKRVFGFGFFGASLLLMAGCQIMILITAFKAHIGWGLGCFFVPLVGLIFIITHWADTKKFLLTQLLGGIPLLVVGILLMG